MTKELDGHSGKVVGFFFTKTFVGVGALATLITIDVPYNSLKVSIAASNSARVTVRNPATRACVTLLYLLTASYCSQ